MIFQKDTGSYTWLWGFVVVLLLSLYVVLITPGSPLGFGIGTEPGSDEPIGDQPYVRTVDLAMNEIDEGIVQGIAVNEPSPIAFVTIETANGTKNYSIELLNHTAGSSAFIRVFDGAQYVTREIIKDVFYNILDLDIYVADIDWHDVIIGILEHVTSISQWHSASVSYAVPVITNLGPQAFSGYVIVETDRIDHTEYGYDPEKTSHWQEEVFINSLRPGGLFYVTEAIGERETLFFVSRSGSLGVAESQNMEAKVSISPRTPNYRESTIYNNIKAETVPASQKIM